MLVIRNVLPVRPVPRRLQPDSLQFHQCLIDLQERLMHSLGMFLLLLDLILVDLLHPGEVLNMKGATLR